MKYGLFGPKKNVEPIERLYGRYNCGKDREAEVERERESKRERGRERNGGKHAKRHAIMILRLAHTGVSVVACALLVN